MTTLLVQCDARGARHRLIDMPARWSLAAPACPNPCLPPLPSLLPGDSKARGKARGRRKTRVVRSTRSVCTPCRTRPTSRLPPQQRGKVVGCRVERRGGHPTTLFCLSMHPPFSPLPLPLTARWPMLLRLFIGTSADVPFPPPSDGAPPSYGFY